MSLPRSSGSSASAVAHAVAGAAVSVAVAVWPWGHNPFGPAKFAVTFVGATVVCVFVALSSGTRERFLAAVRSPVAIAAAAFAAVPALALVTSIDVRASVLGEYPGYAGLAAGAAWLLIAGAAMSVPPDRLRSATGRVVSVVLAVVGLYALVQRLGVQPMRLGDTLDLARTGSLLGNAANLGVWLAIALPVVLDRVRAEEHRVWRLASAVAVALGVLGSAFTGSRGGWLGLVAGLLVWWLVSSARQATGPAAGHRPGAAGQEATHRAQTSDSSATRRPSATVAVAGVAALLVVGIALTPSSASRLAGGGTASATGRGRLAVWSATVALVAERPVLGWGVAGFGRVFPGYATVETVDPGGRTDALEDPHNLELSVAASSGIVGVIALIALVAAAGIAVRRQVARGEAWTGAVAGALAGGFVAAQFHFVTLETGAILALLLGALVALDSTEAQKGSSRLRAAWVPAAVMLAAVMLAAAMLAVGLLAADVAVRRGFAAAASGDTARALAAFDQAERLAPIEPSFVWARGRAMLTPAGRGDTNALAVGIEALTWAADRMPTDSRPLRDLGDLYVAASTQGIGDDSTARAIAAYDAALALAPLDARAWLGRGVAASLAGDLVAAETDIRRAVDIAPRFADAWLNLAAVYDAMGDPARAADARARAGALD